MKKREITYQEGLKELGRGNTVKCQLGSRVDNEEIVHSETRLTYLYELNKAGTQLCKFFVNTDCCTKIPKKAKEISFDDAYYKVHLGELVYYKDGEEEEIISINELINIRRRCESKGKKLLLYVYE